MKKIFTLMAATLCGAAGLMAAPFNPANFEGLKVSMSPEALQRARTAMAEKKLNEGVEYTRSWVDSQGGTWNLALTTEETKLCELLTFSNEAGESFQYSFYEYPFYQAELAYSYTPKNQPSATRYANFILAWPSQYPYSQIFEAGTWDIPESDIDPTIVTPEEFCNNTNLTRTFQQTQSVMNWDNQTGTWTSWTILPADLLKIASEWDGLTMYSQEGSTIDFRMFDAADSSIEVQNRVTFKQDSSEGTRSASMRITYAGTGRVEGFQHIEETVPNFGNIYLFNTGLSSYELDGMDSGFTESYPELTKFYIFCGDENLLVTVDEQGPFDPSKVGHDGLNVAEEDVLEHAQILYGYLYGEPTYAKDQDADPREAQFTCRAPWSAYDEGTKEYYMAEAPVANSFVPMGYSKTWSRECGLLLILHNDFQIAGDYATLGWGNTTGFNMDYATIYNRLVMANGPESEVIYYYDPADLSKKRVFSAVGGKEWSAVESVVADGVEAKVVARDGMISVNAAEKVPVAIFTLDGKLVKAAEAENVAVEAAKGVYVVRVGEKATKVVL